MPKTCSKADVKKLIGYGELNTQFKTSFCVISFEVSQIPQKLFKKRVVCAADLFYHGDKEVHNDSGAIVLTYVRTLMN